MPVKKTFLVEKRNILNEIRSNNMTMQELRFLSIYLAKINARDMQSRFVRFTVDEFARIMDFGNRVNINYLKNATNNLLSKVVNIPTERGGWNAFQLFKECTVDQDEAGVWYVEIDAHDKALPLMFDFKREYFTYELWNALRLRSSNQIIMYELLKQCEKIGERVITVDRLRERLGLGRSEYPLFHDFKRRVLDVCQKALEETTDIKFTYEPYGRKGPGGKILALKFAISKNADYVDQLTLDEFIAEQSSNALIIEMGAENELPPNDPAERYDESMRPLADVTNFEFSNEELLVLDSLIEQRGVNSDQRPAFLQLHLRLMNANDQRKKIKDRFKYLQKLLSETSDKPSRPVAPPPTSEPSPEEIERLEKLLAKQNDIFGQTTMEGM